MLNEVAPGIFMDTLKTGYVGVPSLNYFFVPGKPGHRSLMVDAGLSENVSPLGKDMLIKDLRDLNIPFEAHVMSAHRTPDAAAEFSKHAAENGFGAIIAAAGKAAHLGGVVAAYTPCPVICVPMKTSDLGGLDSLLSMVQMPSGVPVACVAINGAKNAAILAVQMLGTGDEEARQKIVDFKTAMAEA